MIAVLYLLLAGVLAYQVQLKVAVLETLQGLPRYLCSLGLTLFLLNWANFLLYVLIGWGHLYLGLSWVVLFASLAFFAGPWSRSVPSSAPSATAPPVGHRPWFRERNIWFGLLAVFVIARFYAGLDVDDDDNVWSTFNFIDTAFHLSVVNAFLLAPHFPPMDLDMAPFPLKYHFLADFHIAHLVRLGLPALDSMWCMNLVSATVLVGALWAVFERWLRLPPRWVLLAVLIFLFLNTALVNLVHFLALQPPYFDPTAPFYGLLWYPYFNFEFILSNLLEPQRGLLFTMPIVLLILHTSFGEEAILDPAGVTPQVRTRLLQAFMLVCLLPLAHIVAFAVMAFCLIPALWRQRGWFFRRWRWWVPVFAIGLLQLFYLGLYGPPTNAGYSSWAVIPSLPLEEFHAFPAFLRRAVFWFFVNGDFFAWGLLFLAPLLVRWLLRRPGSGASSLLRAFLSRWKWYFAVCGGFFLLINLCRYSFDWGDSNKFVLFLNFGLTLVIVLGSAQWIGRRGRVLSHLLWGFFFVLCVSPVAYTFYVKVIAAEHGAVLLFVKNDRQAAEWIATTLKPTDVVLTAAYNSMHFVTPLGGRPTFAGIYAESDPYRQDERAEQIRQVYEQGTLALLRQLKIRYVCVSRNERRKYTLHARWTRLMNKSTGVVFHSGGGPEDYYSVYIFDVRLIPAR